MYFGNLGVEHCDFRTKYRKGATKLLGHFRVYFSTLFKIFTIKS